VYFFSKSIKPFSIYRKMKYLTFDFDLWPCGQGHKILCFYVALYGYYMVPLLLKSIKPLRIYSKMKYLTFEFDLWTLGQSHEILLFYLTLFNYYLTIIFYLTIIWCKF